MEYPQYDFILYCTDADLLGAFEFCRAPGNGLPPGTDPRRTIRMRSIKYAHGSFLSRQPYTRNSPLLRADTSPRNASGDIDPAG